MRLQEILARLAQIEVELRAEGLTEEQFTALQTESNALLTERSQLEQEGRRNELLQRIAGGAGNVTRSFTPSPSPTGGAPEARGNEDRYDTMEYRRAFMAHVLRGTPIPVEFREDAITATTDVGAVIPTTVLNRIIEKLVSTGMILARVTRTAYRGGLSIPTSSAKPTATWVNEGAGNNKQKKTVAASGMITFSYHKLRCAVAVTLEVDTMAMSAFETLLMNNVVEAMVKTLEQAIVSGDGVGKPKGILAETVEQEQMVNVSEPAYQDLIDAEAALPMAYESGVVYCMTKKTFMAYFGLLDANGQPIGRVNYGIGGKPERMLLGRQVLCCDYLSSYSATLETGTVFGFLFNFNDYLLNTNYAMGVKKYEDNDTDDIVTKAIMLVDGKVVDKSSLVVMKKA